MDGVKVSALLEKESPDVDLESKGVPLDENMSNLNDVSSTVEFTVDVTKR